MPPSDVELITASPASDPAAYAVLYQRHVVAARGLARRLMHGRAEADDAVAEAFARVLAQLKRGKGPDSAFRPYLPWTDWPGTAQDIALRAPDGAVQTVSTADTGVVAGLDGRPAIHRTSRKVPQSPSVPPMSPIWLA